MRYMPSLTRAGFGNFFLEGSDGPERAGVGGAKGNRIAVKTLTFEALGFDALARGSGFEGFLVVAPLEEGTAGGWDGLESSSAL